MLLDGEAADMDVLALTTARAQHSPRIVVLTAHLVAMQYRLAGTPAVVIGKHEGIVALVNALRSHPSNV
jgi:hypothetical protein